MLVDLRLALRQFARSPLFTAAVVLVLGLGVGASTTIFSLLDAYLLKPLPFKEPDRLVSVWRTLRPRADVRDPFSAPDFLDLKQSATSLSHLAALWEVDLNLNAGREPGGGDAAPEHVLGSRVSADFFPALGVSPALGRVFTPDEDAPGRGQVVVLSDALWRRRFGRDPAAVGRTVTLDGKPYQVVGIMPPDFRTPTTLSSQTPAECWLPAALEGTASAKWRNRHAWHLLGRLAPGASLATADAEVRAVAARLEQAHPDTNANKVFYAVGLHDHLARGVKPALLLLLAATLLLLVIASANVALLLLAKASTRGGEAAVRAALGASRARLVRQFLAEGLLLALFGGLAGFALALASVGAVAAGFRDAMSVVREARPDGRVLAFSLFAASAVGLGAGLFPALQASKARLYGLLKEGAARASSGGGRRRLQGALLVAEIALSAVLLAGSSGVARGFYKALNEPLGFETSGALTFSLHLPEARYPDAPGARLFLERAHERLRALPSVTSVGAANCVPLIGGCPNSAFQIEGRPPSPPGSAEVTEYLRANADYFRAMQISLRRGREFTASDREGSTPVMIVNEPFVRRYLPGEEPLGRRVRWGQDGPFYEIVGVVDDVTYWPGYSGRPATYIPLAQDGQRSAFRTPAFVIRTRGEPGALANAVRAAVHELDPLQPVADIKTYEERARDAFGDRRFTFTLVSAFALSALVLTALGLFGLVSYQTRRRSRELAIRMALGAASADVARLVLRDTSRLLLAGLALGLPAAFASGRLLTAHLDDVPPADTLTLAATALLLGMVALVAVLSPARRAARTPPALVLRDE